MADPGFPCAARESLPPKWTFVNDGPPPTAEGWEGIVASFDWPSANSTLNYIEDRSDASKVALMLVNRGITLLATPVDERLSST